MDGEDEVMTLAENEAIELQLQLQSNQLTNFVL
jgi:hypothetical protein